MYVRIEPGAAGAYQAIEGKQRAQVRATIAELHADDHLRTLTIEWDDPAAGWSLLDMTAHALGAPAFNEGEWRCLADAARSHAEDPGVKGTDLGDRLNHYADSICKAYGWTR